MKTKINIGFVILHYKTYKQTINCVKSILENNNYKKIIITIVDNFSNNGSIEIIEKEFKTYENIKILKCNKNLGFARGNNVGIKWINDNYSTKYIAVLNNDTQIINKDFYNLVEEEYKNSKFAIMGPKIKLLNNKTNPICKQNISLSELLKLQRILRRKIIIRYLHIESIIEFIKSIFKKKQSPTQVKLNPNNYYKNIILHGCFLIFSKDYFKIYDGFDERTFLFREEELLFLRIKRSKLTSVYNPKIIIFHEEDASTNYALPNERKRAIFKSKNMYYSNKILINEVKKHGGTI